MNDKEREALRVVLELARGNAIDLETAEPDLREEAERQEVAMVVVVEMLARPNGMRLGKVMYSYRGADGRIVSNSMLVVIGEEDGDVEAQLVASARAQWEALSLSGLSLTRVAVGYGDCKVTLDVRGVPS